MFFKLGCTSELPREFYKSRRPGHSQDQLDETLWEWGLFISVFKSVWQGFRVSFEGQRCTIYSGLGLCSSSTGVPGSQAELLSPVSDFICILSMQVGLPRYFRMHFSIWEALMGTGKHSMKHCKGAHSQFITSIACQAQRRAQSHHHPEKGYLNIILWGNWGVVRLNISKEVQPGFELWFLLL